MYIPRRISDLPSPALSYQWHPTVDRAPSGRRALNGVSGFTAGGRTLSLPDAITITSSVVGLFSLNCSSFIMALVPGIEPVPEFGHRSFWLIDANGGMRLLNDPALGEYLAGCLKLTLDAETLRDLRPFVRRTAELKRRGNRIKARSWVTP